jgi:hypothetical protein
MTINFGVFLHLSHKDKEKVNLAAKIRLIREMGMEIDPHTQKPFPAYTPEDFERVQADIASDEIQRKKVLSTPLQKLYDEEAELLGNRRPEAAQTQGHGHGRGY